MLEKLITFALQQRVFVLVGAFVILITGWQAIENLPVEAFPDVQDVQVQIDTLVPGQAPEEVERSVTLPIEREMSGVAHMTQLRSISITGLSEVILTFSDRTDDYFARQQVMEKLQNVNLPPGIQPSLAPLTNAVGEVYRYVLDTPASMPLNEVRALQDWVLRPALRQVPGVADVVSYGGTIKEYQAVSYTHLRAHETRHDLVCRLLLEKKKKNERMNFDLTHQRRRNNIQSLSQVRT